MLLTAAAAQPAPPASAARQAADVVLQAFDLLMDRYVQPLDSAALLTAAWHGLGSEAGPPPIFSGDREADRLAFRRAFAQVPGQPTGAAIRGMVALCDEQHTQYLDPAEYQQYQAWSRGEIVYAGIGVRIKGAQRTITQVYAGGPAEQAGLLPGDALRQVDGTPVDTAAQASGLIRGPEGSLVQLDVQRGDQPLSLTLQRQRISVDFVTDRMLDGDLGYASLRGFAEPEVADTLEQDVQDLQAQGARGLVLDLRGNDGGRLDVGTHLLDDFLPAESLLYQEIDRSGASELPTTDMDAEPLRLPLVVLVDEATASMGELFASALQEHAAATIVGSTTAGDVAQARTYPLADGSGLQVTERDIVSASGQRLNKVGVRPDVVVDTDPAASRPGVDRVLDEAVAVLHTRLPQ